MGVSWLPLSFGHHASTSDLGRSAIEAARVAEALRHVPLQQRAPLRLHLVAGFSYLKIAELLQVSEGTVRMRISRGRSAFRLAYDDGSDD